MATGLLNIGGTYYLFDMNDGHIVETYTSMPGEYSLIEYESDGGYSVYKYNGETLIGSDTYSAAGQQTYHFELNRTGNVEKSYSWGLDGFYGKEIETYSWTNVYDEYNNIVSYESTGKFVTLIDETGQLEWHEYTNHTDRTYYDAASGKCSYEKGMTYSADGKLTDTTERYFNNDADNCLSGEKICYYEQGILVQVTETVMYEHTTWNKYTEKTTLYDGNGNVSDISVFYYDTEGTELYYEGYDEDGHKIYYGRRDANGEMLYFEAYNLDGSVQYSVTYNPDGTVTWS